MPGARERRLRADPAELSAAALPARPQPRLPEGASGRVLPSPSPSENEGSPSRYLPGDAGDQSHLPAVHLLAVVSRRGSGAATRLPRRGLCHPPRCGGIPGRRRGRRGKAPGAGGGHGGKDACRHPGSPALSRPAPPRHFRAPAPPRGRRRCSPPKSALPPCSPGARPALGTAPAARLGPAANQGPRRFPEGAGDAQGPKAGAVIG